MPCEALNKSSLGKGQRKFSRVSNATITKEGAFLVAENFIWTQAINTHPSTIDVRLTCRTIPERSMLDDRYFLPGLRRRHSPAGPSGGS